MRFSFSLILVLFLTGCKTPQPVVQHTVTVKETLRDTTVIVEPDTASVKALLECDSLNQVVMKELDVVKGRKIAPQVKFRDRVLEITMPVDSEAVYFSWKERHKIESEKVTVTKVVKEKYKPPWYKKALSWIGGVCLVVLLISFKFKSLWFLKFLKKR